MLGSLFLVVVFSSIIYQYYGDYWTKQRIDELYALHHHHPNGSVESSVVYTAYPTHSAIPAWINRPSVVIPAEHVDAFDTTQNVFNPPNHIEITPSAPMMPADH